MAAGAAVAAPVRGPRSPLPSPTGDVDETAVGANDGTILMPRASCVGALVLKAAGLGEFSMLGTWVPVGATECKAYDGTCPRTPPSVGLAVGSNVKSIAEGEAVGVAVFPLPALPVARKEDVGEAVGAAVSPSLTLAKAGEGEAEGADEKCSPRLTAVGAVVGESVVKSGFG